MRSVSSAAASDFAYVDPGEPTTHGRIVAMQADGPGRATLVRLLAVESDSTVLRTANPGRPDIAVARANETVMRAVAMFVGCAVFEEQRPVTLPLRRLDAADVVFHRSVSVKLSRVGPAGQGAVALDALIRTGEAAASDRQGMHGASS